MCTNRFVYKAGPSKVCLSVPQQDPSNETNTEESMGTVLLSDEGITVCNYNWAVSYNVTMWLSLELGICHKATKSSLKQTHTEVQIRVYIVLMLFLWHWTLKFLSSALALSPTFNPTYFHLDGAVPLNSSGNNKTNKLYLSWFN